MAIGTVYLESIIPYSDQGLKICNSEFAKKLKIKHLYLI